MDDESPVLGASGMLRQSSREKGTDEIDVEGSSDTDSEEASPQASLINTKYDEKTALCGDDSVGQIKETSQQGSDQNLSETSSDQKVSGTQNSGSSHLSTCISEASSTQNVSEMQKPGSTLNRISKPISDQKISETHKDGNTENKLSQSSSDQEVTETRTRILESSSNQNVSEIQKCGSTHVLLTERTKADDTEMDSEKLSEKINVTAEEVPEPSSVETPNINKDGALARISDTDTESPKNTSVTISNATQSEVESHKEKLVKFTKARSFEDVFKETLGRHQTPKTVGSDKVIELTPRDDETSNKETKCKMSILDNEKPDLSQRQNSGGNQPTGVDLSDDKEGDSKHFLVKDQADLSHKPVSHRPIIVNLPNTKAGASKEELARRQKSESNRPEIVNVPDQADDSRQTEVENFSSDSSSSTIIDVELTAKESTEEELSGKSSKTSFHPDADSQEQGRQNTTGEVEMETDGSEAQPSDPTTATTDPTTATKPDNEEVGDVEPKKQTSLSTDKLSTTAEDMNTLSCVSKKDKESHMFEHTTKHDEPLRKSRKLVLLGNDGGSAKSTVRLGGAKPGIDCFEYKRSFRSQENTRRRFLTDQSETRQKTDVVNRMRSVLRERSKSDEGRMLTGKRFRISKHGVVLQPGTKVEAMDYSKKW